jgi:excisionase family DNA binding protein
MYKSLEPQPFLTPQEVSDLLRVSVYTIRRWIKEGTLPAFKVGRGWRIRESDLDAWLVGQRPHLQTGSYPAVRQSL